jgi:hypothetical protein
MVRIPGGLVGKNTVKDFYLDRYAVTIGEYQQFLGALAAGAKVKEDTFAESHKNHTPDHWDKLLAAIQRRQALRIGDQDFWLTWDSPVIGMDWYDAVAFANWRGKRLPTDEEWDLAAQNVVAPTNLPPTTHTEVYAVPEDRSPAGVIGLSARLSVWTAPSPTRTTAIARGGIRRRAEIIREIRSDTIGIRCAADKEVK